MAEIIYTKYSNERNRRFCIRTDILEEEGKRFVMKRPLYPEGCSHVEKLCVWYQYLDGLYRKKGLSCNKCKKEKTGVLLEYIEGKTLEEFLDNLLENGEINKAAAAFEKYLRQVEEICQGEYFSATEKFYTVFGEETFEERLACASVTNIDMLCSNLVLTEVPCVLDFEWTFDFPIPGKYVVYRMIHYYVDTYSVRQPLQRMNFYEKMGISKKQKEKFARMEARFQDYITGSHVPMREMFASISPGVRTIKFCEMGLLQVFFSNGSGYYEEKSKTFPIEEGKARGSVEIPEDCTYLRIDPGNISCAVMVSKMEIDGHPVNLGNAVIEKGSVCGNWIYIAKDDPNISEIPVPANSKRMEISLMVHAVSPELLENMRNQVKDNIRLKDRIRRLELQIKEMKNTKVWKLYQSYRNKVERKK